MVDGAKTQPVLEANLNSTVPRGAFLAGRSSVLESEPMPQRLPKIDKSRLPDYLQNSPDVSEMVEYLQEFLVQPGSLEKIYLHEGSHLFFFRKIHPPARFVPPCIWYDKKTGRYFPLVAAVDTEGAGKKCDEARLLAFAKAAVSGGIMLAVQNLRSGVSADLILKNLGDSDDQNNFTNLCQEIRNVSPLLLKFDSDELWHDAKTKIAPDFFNPLVRPQIDAVVTEVKAELLAAIYPDGS